MFGLPPHGLKVTEFKLSKKYLIQAGIPKPLFLTKLAEYGVDTFQLTEDDLQQDIDSFRRTCELKSAAFSTRFSPFWIVFNHCDFG